MKNLRPIEHVVFALVLAAFAGSVVVLVTREPIQMLVTRVLLVAGVAFLMTYAITRLLARFSRPNPRRDRDGNRL